VTIFNVILFMKPVSNFSISMCNICYILQLLEDGQYLVDEDLLDPLV